MCTWEADVWWLDVLGKFLGQKNRRWSEATNYPSREKPRHRISAVRNATGEIAFSLGWGLGTIWRYPMEASQITQVFPKKVASMVHIPPQKKHMCFICQAGGFKLRLKVGVPENEF